MQLYTGIQTVTTSKDLYWPCLADLLNAFDKKTSFPLQYAITSTNLEMIY